MCNYPCLIQIIFLTKDYNPKGSYSFLLFMIISLPLMYKWPMSLEKAWDKLNGSYSNCLRWRPIDPFKAFTGFSFENLPHKKENSERIVNIIKKAK